MCSVHVQYMLGFGNEGLVHAGRTVAGLQDCGFFDVYSMALGFCGLASYLSHFYRKYFMTAVFECSKCFVQTKFLSNQVSINACI